MTPSDLTPRPSCPGTSSARRRACALVAAAALLPGLLAACASQDASAANSTTRAASSDAAAVGQCLRDVGWDVDDADVGQPGISRLPDGVDEGSPDADDYLEAVSTCRESAGVETPGLSDKEKDSFTEQLKAMAQCLRDEGFDDVEDPVDGVWYGPEQYEGDPAFDAASEKCQADMKVVTR